MLGLFDRLVISDILFLRFKSQEFGLSGVLGAGRWEVGVGCSIWIDRKCGGGNL